jgi:hypothetical protein
MEKYTVKFRVSVWSRSFSMEMVDADILKFSGLSSCTECIDEDSWGTCDTAKMNVVA